MQASLRLATPITINRIVAVPNKKLLGPRFKMDQKEVLLALEGLEGESLDAFKRDIEEKGKCIYYVHVYIICICCYSLFIHAYILNMYLYTYYMHYTILYTLYIYR